MKRLNYWFFLLLPLLACHQTSRERAPVPVPQAAELNLVPYRQQQLWGYADTTGKIVIQPSYQEVEFFSYGVARVRRGGLWGLIDTAGKQVLKPTYTKIEEFFDGVASVEVGEKRGVINYTGEVVVPLDDYIIRPLAQGEGKPNFYEVHVLRDHTPGFIKEIFRLRIIQDKKGLYDAAGNKLLPIRYDYIHYLGEGYTVGIKGDSIFDYLLEKEGKIEKLEQSDIGVGRFHNGWAPAFRHDKYGFVDKDLKQVIAFEYDGARPFHKGIAPVRRKGYTGFINSANELVVPFAYEDVSEFKNGLAIARRKGKYGLISEKGLPLTDFAYQSISFNAYSQQYELRAEGVLRLAKLDPVTNKLSILEGYYISGEAGSDPIRAVSSKNGGHGFIDSTGNVVVPFEYSYAGEFKYGLAVVEKGMRQGVIDRQNKTVIPFEYSRASVLSGNIILAEKKRDDSSVQIRLLDRNGKEHTKDYYDKVESLLMKHGMLALYSEKTGTWTIWYVRGEQPVQQLALAPGQQVISMSERTYATAPRSDTFRSRFFKISDKRTGQNGYIGFNGRRYFED